MSGILRNPLRLASIAKYATNNSTKSLSTGIQDIIKNNKLDLKKPSNYCVIKANTKPNVWQNILAAVGQKTFISADAAFFAKIDYFIASLSDAKACVTRQKRGNKLYLPAAFNIKLNEKSIQPIRTEPVGLKPYSYKDCKLYVSRRDGILTLKKLDSGETLIFNHAVHIEAHQKTPQMNNVDVKSIPSIYISNLECHDTKMTVKIEGQDEKTQIIQSRKNDFVDENDDDAYYLNMHGSLDLQYPMTVSLDVSPQIIHIKELGDTFTVYHKINIQAYKDLTIQKEFEKSKIDDIDDIGDMGDIRVLLDSGNLVLRTRRYFDDTVETNHRVWITVDLNGPRPSINIDPAATTFPKSK